MRNGFQRGQLSLVFLFALDYQLMEFSEVLAFPELMAFGFPPDSRAHIALGNTNLVKQLIQRYGLFFLQSFLNNYSVFLIEATQSVPLMLVTISVFNVCFAMECSLAEASVKLFCISEKFQHSLSKLLFGKAEVGCNTEVISSSYDLIVFFFFSSVIQDFSMQTDFCWNYFCASKGDIITEELYGSSNYKKLKEKTALH